MKDINQIEQESKQVLKVIKGANGYVKEMKLVEEKKKITKKVFPKTPSMLPNRYFCGLGKQFLDKQPRFPLVKDDKGEIVIAGTRYSRKRQHYPQDEV